MRKIQIELSQLIDTKLLMNGLAQEHIKNKNPRGLVIEAAKSCVGQREATGKNDGKFVSLVQKTVDNLASGEAWCMAFVQTMIAYAELKTGIKSPLLATEHCLTLWGDTKAKYPDQLVKISPLSGAIVIWQHGNTANGHTGFVLDCDETQFSAIEGNASGYLVPVNLVDSKVNREGNGVFYTRRSRDGNGDMKILGFIKPF